MLNEALSFLFDALLQPFAALLLLRFHLQWLRAPMRNPLGELIMALTDFVVLPARRHIPSAKGIDTASLLLALVVEAVYLLAMLWVRGIPLTGFPVIALLAWTAVKLLKLSVYLLMIALIAQALLSWINPYTPVSGILATITRPFIMPLRRYIPLFGNIDLTPLVLLIVCQLILIVPLGWLENVAVGLL
jgi:YggT family protein